MHAVVLVVGPASLLVNLKDIRSFTIDNMNLEFKIINTIKVLVFTRNQKFTPLQVTNYEGYTRMMIVSNRNMTLFFIILQKC